jgi:hypothetical protein
MYYYQIATVSNEKDAKEIKRLLNCRYLSALTIVELQYVVLPNHLKKYFRILGSK